MTKQATIKKQVAGAAGSTTRRSFLGHVVKVSAVAAVAVAPVKCAPGPMAPAPAHAVEIAAEIGADAELLALGPQFDAAYAEWDAAYRASNDAQKAYYAMRPERPEELIDPFGGVIPWSRVGQGIGARGALWTAADLRLSIERWSQPGAVRFKARDIALARKLLPIAEQYEAADAEARRKTGLSEWLQRDDEAAERVCGISDRILEATATTAAGWALQCRVFKMWEAPNWWDPNAPNTEAAETFAARAMDRLIAQAFNIG